MPTEQYVHLERKGEGQTLRIPQGFELTSDEAILHKDGERLIIEPIQKPSLLALLATLEPITEPFPELDEGLPPLDDIVF